MKFIKELFIHFNARVPVVIVTSYEEKRIIREMKKFSETPDWEKGAGIYSWDIADQFTCIRESEQRFDHKKTVTPDTILTTIEQFQGNAVFVLKDFHLIWDAKKTVIRKLRNLSTTLATSQHWKNILIITPINKIPEELEEDIVLLDCPLPETGEMDDILERVGGRSGALDSLSGAIREKIIETALGLSETQAERIFRKAVVQNKGRLTEKCIDIVATEKRRIIRKSGALEFYPHTEQKTNVGGLQILKQWLEERRDAFSESAKDYGLDAPRGLALIGIPGTGKSLCAKLAAGMWKMPLLRLDMGAIFNSALGSSEKNVRDAIQISEVIAPCILWIDEIEKGFSVSSGDSGTSSRVLATFLTWMQEKKKPVMVFATANDVRRLPPEFLRKGRFDEVFFLDLPTEEERKAIFEVHLRKKRYSMLARKFDLKKLAVGTKGFVGAEIEAVVRDAMFPAFKDGERELDTEDLLGAISDMVPMARSQAGVIEKLREKVKKGEARLASTAESEREIDVQTLRGARFIDK